MSKEKHLNDMSNHLLNNNLIFFIGAVFSNMFGYPDWKDLLKDIIQHYELKEQLNETSLFTFIKNQEINDLESVNNEILENLIGVDYLKLAGYIDFILKTKHSTSIHKVIYEKIEEYEQKRIKKENIEEIISFFAKYRDNINEIITTNYDCNIEFCFDNNISVINRNLESLNDSDNKVKLFKIHGCIRDSFYQGEENQGKNIIITEKDYNNFRINNRYLFYKMYSLFIEKKVVFIGYSINDPNVRSILNDVIEESNDRVNLQVYWVNRDKMKVLDKQYYEDYFKLNIIEEEEIIEFIKQLDTRININKELRSISSAEIEEYSKKFINNYSDISYKEDITDNYKFEEINTYI